MAEHVAVIAVCGHEAAYGRALDGVVDAGVSIVSSGRELFRSIAAHGRRNAETVVVPMTLGRDPELVADTARTLRAVPAGERGTTVLAEPFGTSQHLVAWLRAAAGRVPETSALLVTAPSGDPFEDAELYRIAALVRRHGRGGLVEVAFTGEIRTRPRASGGAGCSARSGWRWSRPRSRCRRCPRRERCPSTGRGRSSRRRHCDASSASGSPTPDGVGASTGTTASRPA